MFAGRTSLDAVAAAIRVLEVRFVPCGRTKYHGWGYRFLLLTELLGLCEVLVPNLLLKLDPPKYVEA